MSLVKLILLTICLSTIEAGIVVDSTKKPVKQRRTEGNGEEDAGDPEFEADKGLDVKVEDITSLKEKLVTLNTLLKSKVFGDLQSTLLIKRMEISYSMYKLINRVRKNYYLHREEAQEQVNLIMNIVNQAKEIIDEKQVDLTDEILEDADALTDYYNHNILIQLFDNLDENAMTLWKGIYIGLDQFIVKMMKIHHNTEMSDEDKVADLLKIAVNLVVFENETITETIDKLKTLQDLVMNNPKYHRIAGTLNYVSPYERNKKNAFKIGVAVFTFLAVLLA